MIKSFRDKWLEDFFRDDITGKKVPSDIEKSLFRRLQMLDDATCDRDLPSPPSNHFEQLNGPLVGLYSIRVTRKWRLLFAFQGETGQATNVYLDPHDYR